MARRVIPAQTRKRVFAAIRGGMSIRKAAAKYKVHAQTVYKWVAARNASLGRYAPGTSKAPGRVQRIPDLLGNGLDSRIADAEQALADLYTQRIKAKVLATFTAAIASGTL